MSLPLQSQQQGHQVKSDVLNGDFSSQFRPAAGDGREEPADSSQQGAHESHEPRLARTVRIMETLRAKEIFGTPAQAKEFFNNLTYEEFKRYLDFVNGVERQIPLGERGKVSDSRVQGQNGLGFVWIEYLPPHQIFRDPLLERAFEKVKGVEDPQMAALTLGLAINAIHYFADGNGRTARMVYSLISRGYDGSSEAQQYYSDILENGKGREIVNPNPARSNLVQNIRNEFLASAIKRYGYGEYFADSTPSAVFGAYSFPCAEDHGPETLIVADEVSSEARIKLHLLLNTEWVAVSLMVTFPPERVADHVRIHSDKNYKYVDGESFFPTLSESDIDEWYYNSQLLTVTYVKRLIDVSDRPDAAELVQFYGSTVNKAEK